MNLENIVGNQFCLTGYKPQLVPQRFVCLLREKDKTFQNSKKCKYKDFNLACGGKMVKKQGKVFVFM